MGFYIQDSYWKAVEKQPKKVQQEVIWAMTRLYFTGEEPDGISVTSESLFRMSSDRVVKARQEAIRKQEEREDKSGTDNATNSGQTPDTSGTNCALPLIERESESKSKKNFIPPTREEASEYLASIGLRADLDKIFDHYESNGWKCGKNPMKDWKAAFRRAAREWAKGGVDHGEYTGAF